MASEQKKPSSAAWVGAIALLVVVSGLNLFIEVGNEDINGMPFRMGRALGTATVGIVIGYFFWWLFRKSRPPGSPKWSPWVFVIAAGFALLNVLPAVR